jgi:DNA-binding HxlR family transcriptional regulator
MELVAHRWTIHILFALHEAGGPARFRELQRRVAPIAQKELMKR